jgi:hypothetical protein
MILEFSPVIAVPPVFPWAPENFGKRFGILVLWKGVSSRKNGDTAGGNLSPGSLLALVGKWR